MAKTFKQGRISATHKINSHQTPPQHYFEESLNSRTLAKSAASCGVSEVRCHLQTLFKSFENNDKNGTIYGYSCRFRKAHQTGVWFNESHQSASRKPRPGGPEVWGTSRTYCLRVFLYFSVSVFITIFFCRLILTKRARRRALEWDWMEKAEGRARARNFHNGSKICPKNLPACKLLSSVEGKPKYLRVKPWQTSGSRISSELNCKLGPILNFIRLMKWS